VAEYSGDGVKR